MIRVIDVCDNPFVSNPGGTSSPLLREIPQSLVALVHDVELNEAAWWDTATKRIVEAALWLGGESMSSPDLARVLSADFGIRLSSYEVERLLYLEPRHVVQQNELYGLTEAATAAFVEKVKQAEDLERRAGEFFNEAVAACCPETVDTTTWERFNRVLLLPMIRELGAQTYEFINGEGFQLEASNHLERFLNEHEPDARPRAQAAVIQFLNPREEVVRSYVLRQLSASFLTSAANLDDKKIKQLASDAEKEAEFHVFTDTNFLFSLFTLHDNPSNEAARRLSELTQELKGVVDFRLLALPISLAETKNAVAGTVDSLKGIVLTQNYLDAIVEQRDLSSLALMFIDQARRPGGIRDPEEYFRPYTETLIDVVREQHVELYNEKTDAYNTRDDVIEDINSQLEWEKDKFGERAKSYEKLKHDIVLWHFVKDRRSAFVESPLGAKYWTVTVDYRLLGFDAFKQRRRQQLPVCLHPSVLVQMLQFWTPRTVQLEEALLSTIRLPFLFQEFDPDTELVTVRILQALSRIQGSAALSSDTIGTMLIDKELRRRMRSADDINEQIQLVRDEFVEQESRLRREMDELKRRLEEAAGARVAAETTSTKLVDDLEARGADLERMTSELHAISQERQQVKDALVEAETDRDRLQRNVDFYGKRLPWVILLSFFLGVAVAWFFNTWTEVPKWQQVLAGASVTLLSIIELMVRGLPPTAQVAAGRFWGVVSKFRTVSRSILGFAVTGVIGNATWFWIRSW